MLKKNLNKYYIFFLFFFSISINQYYGYIGIFPIDSFLIFNSGFDFMNGYLPFRDYWTIKEPFIDFLQAVFFWIFDVSWFSYVLHASFFNCLITLATYFILKKFNLNIHVSFFYSICVAVLTYPNAGTPFSDLHTLIFCIISLYFFILAIREKNNWYWFFLPFLLGFAFFSKQAPTAYFVIIISFFSLCYFLFNKNYKSLLFSFLGLISFILFLYLLIYINQINLKDLIYQYILFPQSLGSSRLDWVFPMEFKRFVWRFKLHYLAMSFLLYVFIKEIYKNKMSFCSDNLLIIGSIISSCIALIFHQLMTINGMFVFCVIPILAAFSNIFSNYYLKKKKITYFLIFLTLASTVHYYSKYIKTRSFMDLNNVNLNNSIDGGLIHKKLAGIEWITLYYPDEPLKEVELLNLSSDFLKDEKRKKMIITDYQFISVFNNEYDNSVTRFWWEFHGYPTVDNKYFSYWKEFVLNKIRRNKIEVIYIIKPFAGGIISLDNILDECSTKKKINEILDQIVLKDC